MHSAAKSRRTFNAHPRFRSSAPARASPSEAGRQGFVVDALCKCHDACRPDAFRQHVTSRGDIAGAEPATWPCGARWVPLAGSLWKRTSRVEATNGCPGATAVDSYCGSGNSCTMSNRRHFGGSRRSNSVRFRRPLSVRSHFRTNGLPIRSCDPATVLPLLQRAPHVRANRV